MGKALGCGVHFTWLEIEIAGRPRPAVSFSGKTKAWAEKMGVEQIDLSMTHSKGMAAAVAILSFEDKEQT